MCCLDAGVPCVITATDILRTALSRATAGEYEESRLEALPVGWQNLFFDVDNRDSGKWRVTRKVRSCMRFGAFNLLHPCTEAGTFDVIFCRNVMIYFPYFMSPIYQGEALPEIDSLGVSVRFTGPIRGQFTLRVSRGLAGRMTSEFLACEAPLPGPGQIEATVRELANVACGTFMSAWMPDANFEYGVPIPVTAALESFAHSFSVGADQPEVYLCVYLRPPGLIPPLFRRSAFSGPFRRSTMGEMAEYTHSAQAVFELKYHLICCTKYRYKILRGRVAERVRDLIRQICQICQARDVVIIRGAVSPDHIHMLVSAPPILSPTKLAQYIKGRSSRHLQAEFPDLRKRYWGQ